MSIKHVINADIPANSTFTIKFKLKKETGEGLPVADLTTLILTHYFGKVPSTIINSRDGQDVKNANNVTVDSDGLVTWLVQEEDTALVANTSGPSEEHVALFKFTYNSGAQTGFVEIVYTVEYVANG